MGKPCKRYLREQLVAKGVPICIHCGYDLRGQGRWPSEAEKRGAAALARLEGVRYDPATRTLRLERGVTLDLDGIAKGFALDRAAAALRARGVDDALLNFGGQILSVGPPARCPAKEAIVADSAAPDGGSLRVPVRDASLSTSADSERVRTVAGKEAGHLLDPRTGTFVRLPGSVSVLAPTGALADALSTAWAVAGPDGYSRSLDDSPLRRAGAVAFVLKSRDGRVKTLHPKIHGGLLGVRRAYRKMGVGLAMQLRGIAYARAHGCPQLKTCTAVQNAPMQAMFNKLGYARDPEWQQCQKDITPAGG